MTTTFPASFISMEEAGWDTLRTCLKMRPRVVEEGKKKKPFGVPAARQ